MKNYIVIGAGAIVIIGLVFIFTNKKGNPPITGESNKTTVTTESADPFKNITDTCSVLTKEKVSELAGKPIIKTVSLTTNTLHSCQYYLNDSQAIIINNDFLNVEDQKKGHEFLDRKIVTNPNIPMDNFLVIQEDGLINEIYLVLGPSEYVSINRTSAKTLTEEEIVAFAAKLAGILTGKTPLTKSTSVITLSPTEKKESVPLPQETDIVNTFFNLIGEKKPSDAVSMMKISDDSEKQAWAVQFNAMNSIQVVKVEPSMQEEWTDTTHSYKVTLDVKMKPESASAPIPYYGWENGNNIRWIHMEKIDSNWKIAGISTGP